MKRLDEEEKKTLMAMAFLCFMTIFITLSFSGCKTQVKVVTEYRDRIVHDTTQVVDSVYQDRVHYMTQNGDTIFKTDSVFLYKYRYLDHDVNVYVHDSIPYPVEVVKEVRKRSGYDKFCSWAFWIMVACGLGAGAWWAFKKFYLHK